MGETRKTYVDLGPEMPSENEFLRSKALLQSMHSGGAKLHNENRGNDPKTGNLYDHLVTLLKLILETQPTHALDQFEVLSYQVKRERGGGTGGSGAGLVVEDTEARATTEDELSAEYKHAKIEETLLKHPKHKWDEPPYSKATLPANWGGIFDDEYEMQRLQNLGITSFLVEEGGIGLGRSEMLRVWLSIRKLSLKLKTVVKLNFWGKILGTEGCYYIAEGEFEPGMPPDNGVPAPYDDWRPYTQKKEDKVSPDQRKYFSREDSYGEDGEKKSVSDELPEEQTRLSQARKLFLQDLPKNKWCPPAPIPSEIRGRGLNRWDYFACTNLGSDEWFRLPPVRTEHIFHARHIRRLFVGKPDAPSTNSSYHICLLDFPAGIYEIDEEAELEEGEQPETLMEVEDFEPLEFEELLNRNNWQHIRPYILPQGRCSFVAQKQAVSAMKEILDGRKDIGWINPIVAQKWIEKFKAKGEMNDEETEEEGGEGEQLEEPQEGPNLLGTIAEDTVLKATENVGLPTARITRSENRSIKLTSRPLIAWRVKPSSVLLPKNCCVAIVSSGRWPGAHALARGADFVNVYIGWGQKVLSSSFSPLRLPKLMTEFNEEQADGLIEVNDPTSLEEEFLRQKKKERHLARETKAEEEENEESGEEDEYED
ncbi:unnamed protein product [Heterobilharzia americana]|nr:unnamed protein product [Heterobilharzia americana]